MCYCFQLNVNLQLFQNENLKEDLEKDERNVSLFIMIFSLFCNQYQSLLNLASCLECLISNTHLSLALQLVPNDFIFFQHLTGFVPSSTGHHVDFSSLNLPPLDLHMTLWQYQTVTLFAHPVFLLHAIVYAVRSTWTIFPTSYLPSNSAFLQSSTQESSLS